MGVAVRGAFLGVRAAVATSQSLVLGVGGSPSDEPLAIITGEDF